MLKHKSVIILIIALIADFSYVSAQPTIKDSNGQLKIGAYYFDGWSGQNRLASDQNEPWAKNAPRMLTRRFIDEFPDREPLWGWRNDSQLIMERQIDLAADNGIEFFLFCWYWMDNKGPINIEGIQNLDLHTSLNLYLKARNKNRIKFGFLVANHEGSEIIGMENWEKGTEFWMQYFKDPQYFKVGGKPLVVIFNPSGIDNNALARMQDVAKKQGLPGLSIAGCGNEAGNKYFTYKTHYNITKGYAAGSEGHNYSELVDAHKQQWAGTVEQPYIPEVTVGWDKRPWEGATGLNQPEGWYFMNRTPEQFKNFLTDATIWMNEHPTETTTEHVILIYAWNELGEGGYLVPTKGDPESEYLKVIRNVVKGK